MSSTSSGSIIGINNNAFRKINLGHAINYIAVYTVSVPVVFASKFR